MSTLQHSKKSERPALPVLPTGFLRQHGYDIEEGSHSAADAALLATHGQEDNGLPVRRVRSGVRRLLADGKISTGEAAAAERWSSDYLLGVCGAHNPQLRGSSCKGDVHGFQIARLEAVSRHRQASACIGEFGSNLIRMFAAECKGLAIIAETLAAAATPPVPAGAQRKDVAARKAAVATRATLTKNELVGALVLCLRQLAAFYGDKDSGKGAEKWWLPRDEDTGKLVLRSVHRKRAAA